jgi:5-amino-6-(5-phosphoribosylamino)uracil reductase
MTNDQQIDWVKALAQLKKLGLQKLAVLGGGELVASLLAVDAIDEFWLTVCPVILGGNNAPTPVEGEGFLALQARRLKLLSVQQVEEEIFLHYQLQR